MLLPSFLNFTVILLGAQIFRDAQFYPPILRMRNLKSNALSEITLQMFILQDICYYSLRNDFISFLLYHQI